MRKRKEKAEIRVKEIKKTNKESGRKGKFRLRSKKREE
jgi:hypothetical protein